jgi:hypothetical protein
MHTPGDITASVHQLADLLRKLKFLSDGIVLSPDEAPEPGIPSLTGRREWRHLFSCARWQHN